MNKALLGAAVIAIAGMQIQSARDEDREWATAGEILTGVAIGAVIANAVDAHVSYSLTYSSAPAYYPPPVRIVYAPAVVCAPPVVVYRSPAFCAPPVRLVSYAARGHGR